MQYTIVEKGASIGANATIVCGTKEMPRKIGQYALVGAGSVVTRDVPDNGFVVGVPARLKGFVDSFGQLCKYKSEKEGLTILASDKEEITVPSMIFQSLCK